VLWIWFGLGLIALAVMCSTLLYFIGKGVNKNPTQAILDASPYRKQSNPTPLPLNDPLARNKVYEKRREEQMSKGVVKYDPNQELQMQEGPQIIGLAEPQGFWTKFIMGQKMGYIKMRMSLQNDKGSFWTTLIKAQAASQGKDQGRGR